MSSLPFEYLRLKESLSLALKEQRLPQLCWGSSPRPLEFKLCSYQKTLFNDGLYYNICNQQTDYNHKVIRPLLNLSRKDITRICQHENIPVYPDKSNQSLKYSRNRIRKQIIPSIQLFFNPLTEDALSQFAESLSQEQDLISGLVNTARAQHCPSP